jgi:hypothetical protein
MGGVLTFEHGFLEVWSFLRYFCIQLCSDLKCTVIHFLPKLCETYTPVHGTFSLVRPKLEYASCVWDPIYEVHSAKIERVQGKFIKYALRSLGRADPLNLPPYENRCRLIHLDTLAERRNKACVMFVFVWKN